MSTIRQRLEAQGTPFITLNVLATKGLLIEYGTLKARLRLLSTEQQPNTWLAGGSPTMMLEEAIQWAERHEREHSEYLASIGLGHIDPVRRQK